MAKRLLGGLDLSTHSLFLVHFEGHSAVAVKDLKTEEILFIDTRLGPEEAPDRFHSVRKGEARPVFGNPDVPHVEIGPLATEKQVDLAQAWGLSQAKTQRELFDAALRPAE